MLHKAYNYSTRIAVIIPSLDNIGRDTGTDKHHLHHYLEFYGSMLDPYRHCPVTLVEIGVMGGNSLMMWERYFDHPDSKFFGLDIHDAWFPPEGTRMKVRIGDASTPEFVNSVIQETGPIDIFVDDGSHYSDQQKKSLELFWPHIRPRGIAIIEDTHTSYTYPWLQPGEESFVHSMKKWIDDLNENGKDHIGVPTTSEIEEIVFRKSLVVIKKR